MFAIEDEGLRFFTTTHKRTALSVAHKRQNQITIDIAVHGGLTARHIVNDRLPWSWKSNKPLLVDR
jgi:hypothetical protein